MCFRERQHFPLTCDLMERWHRIAQMNWLRRRRERRRRRNQMATASWRGTVGVVKPTYGSGSLVEFIRLLPEGVGVIPMYADIKQHTEQGYLDALESYNERVAELARIGVDLMHPEGGPPVMVRGYRSEQEIVQQWEAQYKVPIFTSEIGRASCRERV